MTFRVARPVEWPTLFLLLACYLCWGIGVFFLAAQEAQWLFLPLAVLVTALAAAMQSSLQHEAIHGHPFRSRLANAALVFPALTLFIPYLRFRDTHLAHHKDAILTDPYDDPESNYLDAGVWEKLPRMLRAVLAVNNTLAGRIVLGPLVGQVAFLAGEVRAIRGHDADHAAAVWRGWTWHLPAVALVLVTVAAAPMPLWAYLIAAYMALGFLKIRTFLEHRAHDTARARTVIIEDRGPLALLFLNNNLHVVHHLHPRVPWYRLPTLYRANPARYLGLNDGYRYASYAEVFRRYLLRAKDPVAHPLWRR